MSFGTKLDAKYSLCGLYFLFHVNMEISKVFSF